MIIKDFMTIIPVQADISSTLRTVERIMVRYSIRHLPLTENSKLVGIISARDLQVASAMESVNIDREPARSVAVQPALEVPIDTPLARAAEIMLEEKVGSLVVVNDDKIVGIFTLVDALKALLHYCEKQEKQK